MHDVFNFRNELVDRYRAFSTSFSTIAAQDIRNHVDQAYNDGRYWPEPLLQINPNYKRDGSVNDLVADATLHHLCASIFQVDKPEKSPKPMFLYKHQVEAIAKAQQGRSYVVTTGTGSGKSLSFFIPVIDAILKAKEIDAKPRTKAIVIYPMNALANSQLEELNKFLYDYDDSKKPFTVARYTGQETQQEREQIAKNPPDILLTNFMMLELILTRFEETDRKIVENCNGLNFLVLDELHTYRGRQGADVAMLVRRLRDRLSAKSLICIGTSATMSTSGSESDRNLTVATVASKLFGAEITADDVIGETLERVTDTSKDITAILPLLNDAVMRDQFTWDSFDTFTKDPFSIWVELTLGIDLSENKPKRAQPLTLSEAANKLASDAQVDVTQAKLALQSFLVAAHALKTPQGRAPFAFKLHQFISGPGKVMTTLEAQDQRHITLDAQKYAPGRQGEGVELYSAHFCRECGQEYHPVWHQKGHTHRYDPREIGDISAEGEEEVSYGFLCPTNREQQFKGALEDLPEEWLDMSKGEPKVKPTYRHSVPQAAFVDAQGRDGSGEKYWYIPGKFRFCLSCGHKHEAYGKDANRLASLSGEGRSSATTMLTLSTLQQLFLEEDIPKGMPDPRKLLGFSDNRQDAALQAGHFNDFIFLLLVRSALVRALQDNDGLLAEETLADEVFKALGFDSNRADVLMEYLQNPSLMGPAKKSAQSAMRFILGYRLLHDLRRGWRYNNPNLDQLDLLTIEYDDLDNFAAENTLFVKDNLLAGLSVENRKAFIHLVFDEMRQALCIQSRYFDSVEQDKNKNIAHTHLSDRWVFATDEKLVFSKSLVIGKLPETRKGQLKRSDLVGAGARSRLVRQLKKKLFSMGFANQKGFEDMIVSSLETLMLAAKNYGYVSEHRLETMHTSWQLNASVMQWKLVKAAPEKSSNRFFKHLYLTMAEMLRMPEHPLFNFESHEHTAQVDAPTRQLLEQRFRFTEKDQQAWQDTHDTPLKRLPVMFCSPTMELGVDISSLNTVYMRNVPPTPANYAQRSGRAGRSGQPALVITYCAAMSPHDQWFFHHANEMVHGVVRAPTLDLTNRDLVESHLHAEWLAATQVALATSIAPLLDLSKPNKPLLLELSEPMQSAKVSEQALQSAKAVMTQLTSYLDNVGWFDQEFTQSVIEQAHHRFEQAFDRWRNLYEATEQQMHLADQVIKSHSVSNTERENARRRYSDASRQLTMLLKEGSSQNNDFYTYRYLASQGFLPGYNFPRLPLMAWIPGSGKGASGKEDEGSMVSRPRFLALSEFGPRSLIYHQGRMYRVHKAKLNVGVKDHISSGSQLATLTTRVCSQCGYGHIGAEDGSEPLSNCCDNCGATLTDKDWVRELYRIETVETKPVERISINDEDRQRQGFELQTTYRFPQNAKGVVIKQEAQVVLEDAPVATITYAPAAQIWRINRGWRRRKDKNILGFYINPISGLWSKQEDPNANDEPEGYDEADSSKVPPQRIVPFVEDHRNILILTPDSDLPLEAMATLQAALKRGIEQTFQIEESELVAEPLPNIDERQALMFYEAAEGGAGVLTRLATEPTALAMVAEKALELMHFNRPPTGWSLEQLSTHEVHKDGHAICEAGCYQCLLSYFNQPDHDHIDRRNQDALKMLVALANARVELTQVQPSAKASTSGDMSLLDALNALGLPAPDAVDVAVANGAATVAVQYKLQRVLVFTDYPNASIIDSLVNKGWQCLDASKSVREQALNQLSELLK